MSSVERGREIEPASSAASTPSGDLSGKHHIAYELLSTELPPINLEKFAAEGDFYEEWAQFLDLFEAASAKLTKTSKSSLRSRLFRTFWRHSCQISGEQGRISFPVPPATNMLVHYSIFVGAFVEFIALIFF